jgi:exopolyphosphatase/guanosine-5'-triphosphate,3'-diphosphate pyrophosphatase
MIKNLAAIDLGTNSFHLLIVQSEETGRTFRVLDHVKETIRLGSGSTDMKHLSEKAMARAIEALKRFKQIADSYGAQVRAIGTSALREALNRSQFITRIKAETGITVEVVSGFEEARLIYLGVLQALPLFNRQTLLFDIGGGSTEFLIGLRRRVLYGNSLKLGAMRLDTAVFSRRKVQAFENQGMQGIRIGNAQPHRARGPKARIRNRRGLIGNASDRCRSGERKTIKGLSAASAYS